MVRGGPGHYPDSGRGEGEEVRELLHNRGICLSACRRLTDCHADALSPGVIPGREYRLACTARDVDSNNSSFPALFQGFFIGIHGRTGMVSPGTNNCGSSVACCRSSPVYTHCRAVPVARPGCPVVHPQASASRSPGDLWPCCIGTISPLRLSYISPAHEPLRSPGEEITLPVDDISSHDDDVRKDGGHPLKR